MEKEATDEESDDGESEQEAEEWTAILPVPLHYLCLRALNAPAFAIFLRSAMGQTERDNGVHVIMHQQPCDSRRPLMWGHVILYGSKEQVERGTRALSGVMDSGYQYKADGRLLVAVVQDMHAETAQQTRAARADDADWDSDNEDATIVEEGSSVDAHSTRPSRVRRAAAAEWRRTSVRRTTSGRRRMRRSLACRLRPITNASTSGGTTVRVEQHITHDG